MRLHHPIFLFLLPGISTTAAVASSADLTSNVARPTNPALLYLELRDIANANDDVLGASTARPKRTPDAPVDGKDGKPHAGVASSTEGGDHKQTAQSQGKSTVSEGSGKFDATVSSLGSSKNGAGAGAGADADARGTDGTVSGGRVPEGPKEAPPLHYSEQRKEDVKSAANAPGTHTAKKLHDIPSPKSPASVKDDPYASAALKGPSSVNKLGNEELPAGSPLHSLVFSFTMIIVSEIGDKTFLVAALMAMRHPRLLVFSAAFSALIGMTVLSAVLGHGIPTLIPKTFTKFMAALLFFIFGLKMLKEGRDMDPNEGVGEEMREVEQELEEKEQEQLRLGRRRRSSVTPHSLEAGRLGPRRQSRAATKNRMPSPPESLSSSSSRETSPSPTRRWNDALVGMSNLFSLLLSPAWVQTFAMTFLGEWGDRSQIATIAMAAGQDYWWVTVGAATGHGICTAAAVIGGSAIAGKVSMRVVTLGGATAFLVFGVIYLIEALY